MSKKLLLSILFFMACSLSAEDSLVDQMVSENPEIRQNALMALLSADEQTLALFVEDLKIKLTQTDPVVQASVMKILARLGPRGEKAVPYLTQLARDARFQTRLNAIATMGAIGSPPEVILASLEPMLLDDQLDLSLRIAAVDSLSEMGPAAQSIAKTLRTIIVEDRSELRWHAVRALGEIQASSKNDISIFIQALSLKDPLVKKYAVQSLQKIGPAAIPQIESKYKKADPQLRQQLEVILQGMGSEKATRSLERIQHP